MIKVAINGFGRIGRLVFRIMEENPNFEVVAINDLTDAKQLSYLLKYDTSHRLYKKDISYVDDTILVDGRKVKVFAKKNPEELPWGLLGIDEVFECTGLFTTKESSNAHIIAGAKKVIISAPAKGDLKTIVFNVNSNIIEQNDNIISAASCTTNCLAPVLKILNDNFGVKKGYMTTVHAYTNDQSTLDVAHRKGIESRRGRAAASNIIPTTTGAAKALGLVIPSLNGRIKGSALRVPVTTGSLIDLTLELEKQVSVEQINSIFESNTNSTINITYDPIVSSDIISSSLGALVDGSLTNIVNEDQKQLVKVVAWYDNEMGYSNQMVRTALELSKYL